MYKRVENEYTSESYINNWSTQLWLTTILTIILLSLFLYSIIYISTSHSSTNIDRNISTCFLEQISILSSQGSSLSTNISTCLRIITLTCLLFYYLLFNYYNTFLLSQVSSLKYIFELIGNCSQIRILIKCLFCKVDYKENNTNVCNVRRSGH